MKAILQRLNALRYRGNRVECPCCGGRFRRFVSGGVRRREAARCPGCGSLERHRLLWLFLERFSTLYLKPYRVLHVAPELQLARHLARQPNLRYLSADLDSPIAMERVDLTRIPHPDASFDVVLCCHVLEHIPDDHRAMRELRRILAPGGFGVLQTPVHSMDETLEDPDVTDPEERRRRFGQPDHVRMYGRDFHDRLRAAGFRVHRLRWSIKELDPAEVERFGLRLGEAVIVVTPDPAAAPDADPG
jgi:SAM-dependent methyltransferase